MMGAGGVTGNVRGGSVVGVALGLLVLIGAVVSLARQALSREPEPDEALADWIALGTLPFGLAPESAARRGGDLLVTYASPAAADEAPGPELEERESSKDGKREPEEFDWSSVAIGPAGTPPIELLAMRYGGKATERVERLFAPPREEEGETADIKTFDADGGRATMDRGRVRWHDYEVVYVHQRWLERGGTFRDVMQVNLSLPGRPLVLWVRWPRGFPASLERLEELLAAVRPVRA